MFNFAAELENEHEKFGNRNFLFWIKGIVF